MPRKETGSKIGPRSGRINPSATLHPQSLAQIYRVYNTGGTNCPAHGLTISEQCSADFLVEPNTNVLLGATEVEAVYELLPSVGLRSGRFKKAKTNPTIIKQLGRGTIYRFFNTRKGNQAITVTVAGTPPHVIPSECSKDIFIADTATVDVGANDEGVYDFLAFYVAGATPEGSVRSGHFKGKASGPGAVEIEIAKLGAGVRAVYRILNSGSDKFTYGNGTLTNQTLRADTSCDIEVPASGTLKISLSTGTTEFQGSYELLKII